jgi:phenylacetate-CoA ligase
MQTDPTSSTQTPQAQQGEKMALALFHEAATRVPAYKDFLKKHQIDHATIRTITDFDTHVPVVDKQNYISQYPLAELCLDGTMANNRIISGSSGSSGVPFFWPRGRLQDEEGMAMFGEIYDEIFAMDTKTTLLVICYSMGTWIAGTFALTTALAYIDKGRPVNVVTPGIDKEEAVKAIQRLSSQYEQTVLVGYPPIVKDVIDEAKRIGVDWSQLKTRLLLSSEAFSEEWRDYTLELVGSHDPYHDSSSIYGSADAGIFGIETPLSVLIRRLYNQAPELRQAVFGTDILPTIVQYDPKRRYFEQVNGELVFTSNAGLPLIRYNTLDTGGVMSLHDAIAPIKAQVLSLAKDHGIEIDDWQRPCLYVNGRKLFVVTIYGANIYPENIKAGLLDPLIRSWVTGKFTMATKNYSDMDQYFEINVELAHDSAASSERQHVIERAIIGALRTLNAEFHKLETVIGDKAHPKVRLVPFGDPDYFAAGAKHKWIRKEA